MTTITRGNTTITLTAEEIHSIMQKEHRQEVYWKYEDAVKECEEEGWISFDSWAENESGAEYASLEDARSDFIEKLTGDYLEEEELYDRSPGHFRSYADYDDDVLILAEYFGYKKEE